MDSCEFSNATAGYFWSMRDNYFISGVWKMQRERWHCKVNGLLERPHCHQKISVSRECPWRNSQAVAYQTSSLASLSSSNLLHQSDHLFLPHDKLPCAAKFTYSCWPLCRRCQPLQRSWDSDLERSCWVWKSYSDDLQGQPFEVASADAGWSWLRVHGRRDKEMEMENHKTYILCGRTEIHWDQVIV